MKVSLSNSVFASNLGSRDYVASVLIHGFVVIMAIFFMVNDKENLVLLKKKLTVKNKKLVDSSVRVDIVSMPRLTIQELKKIKTFSAPIKIPKKIMAKTKVEKAKVKNSPKVDDIASKGNFQSLLKSLSEKKIDLKKVEKRKTLDAKNIKDSKLDSIAKEKLKEFKKLVIEGNKLSKGNQLFSNKNSSAETKAALESYAANITNQVKAYWSLPSYLLKKKINCQIRVYISENGDLIRSEVYKKSGNSEFDQRAISAVEKASPFTAPDSEIVPRLVQGEILLGFPL